MKELKYRIDKEPVDWQEIIERAKNYGYTGEIMQTSVAASILRENGHEVDENPDFKSN